MDVFSEDQPAGPAEMTTTGQVVAVETQASTGVVRRVAGPVAVATGMAGSKMDDVGRLPQTELKRVSREQLERYDREQQNPV